MDDTQAIAAIRAGDTDAFRYLVERHQNRVFGVICRLTDDRDLAEEIAQEAFVRAYRGLPSFRGDSSFSPHRRYTDRRSSNSLPPPYLSVWWHWGP